MPRVAFLWALGLATVVLGVVAVVMAIARRRARATKARGALRGPPRVVADGAPTVRTLLRAEREELDDVVSFDRSYRDGAASDLGLGTSADEEPRGHEAHWAISRPGVMFEDEERAPRSFAPRGRDAGAATKICPTCGLRYTSGYSACIRDESELTALN